MSVWHVPLLLLLFVMRNYSYRTYLPIQQLAQNAHYKVQLQLTNGRYRRAPTIARAVVSKTVLAIVHKHRRTIAHMILLRDSIRWIMFWLLCYLYVFVRRSDLIARSELVACSCSRLLAVYNLSAYVVTYLHTSLKVLIRT